MSKPDNNGVVDRDRGDGASVIPVVYLRCRSVQRPGSKRAGDPNTVSHTLITHSIRPEGGQIWGHERAAVHRPSAVPCHHWVPPGCTVEAEGSPPPRCSAKSERFRHNGSRAVSWKKPTRGRWGTSGERTAVAVAVGPLTLPLPDVVGGLRGQPDQPCLEHFAKIK